MDKKETYAMEIITDVDYAEDLALITNTSAQVESQRHSK